MTDPTEPRPGEERVALYARADLRQHPGGPVVFRRGERAYVVQSWTNIAEFATEDGRTGTWSRDCFLTEPPEPEVVSTPPASGAPFFAENANKSPASGGAVEAAIRDEIWTATALPTEHPIGTAPWRDELVGRILAALTTTPPKSEGASVCVPLEPTEAMRAAGKEARGWSPAPELHAVSIYRAMIAAAPPPSVNAGEGEDIADTLRTVSNDLWDDQKTNAAARRLMDAALRLETALSEPQPQLPGDLARLVERLERKAGGKPVLIGDAFTNLICIEAAQAIRALVSERDEAVGLLRDVSGQVGLHRPSRGPVLGSFFIAKIEAARAFLDSMKEGRS